MQFEYGSRNDEKYRDQCDNFEIDWPLVSLKRREMFKLLMHLTLRFLSDNSIAVFPFHLNSLRYFSRFHPADYLVVRS